MAKKDTKLKVLHVTLFIDIGGLEKLIFDMGNMFISKGFEVEILCLRQINKNVLSNLNIKNIPIHLFRKQNRLDIFYHHRVASFIRDKQFNIIHAHSGCFWDAALFRLLSGVKKYIYTAHGLPIAQGVKAKIEDATAGFLADNVVTVSREIEKVSQKLLPFCKNSISTIINGTDTNIFRPIRSKTTKKKLLEKYNLPENHLRIGSVGRLAPEKNYRMLITSFAILLPKYNNKIDLILVGDGDLEKELIDLVKELNIYANVYFLGIQHKINEILPLLDVFALSSQTEGTSISLLEAQSCGIPAVVTDVGGNGFIIQDKITGMLCRPNEPKDLAAKVSILLENKPLAESFSHQARKRIKNHFSLHAMVDNYEVLYRS